MYPKSLGRLWLVALAGVWLMTPGSHGNATEGWAERWPEGWHGATVLMYHRFGNDRYPTTSISASRFRAQVEFLAKNFRVVSLGDVVEGLSGRKELPSDAVAITVDDGFTSFARVGWPILRAAGLPVTVFINTRIHDTPGDAYLSWEQIERLHGEGVDFQPHGVRHVDLTTLPPEQARKEMARSRGILEQRLGKKAPIFSYPYGKANTALMKAAEKEGFTAAFGQHSGAVHPFSPRYYLNRFSVADALTSGDGVARVRLAASSLPFPVADLTPFGPQLAEGVSADRLTFRLLPGPWWSLPVGGVLSGRRPPDDVACFVDGKRARVKRSAAPDGNGVLIAVRPMNDDLLPPTRHSTRVNCTARAFLGKDTGPRYRWLGVTLFR